VSTIVKAFGRYTYTDENRGIEILYRQLYARHFDASAHVTVTATDPDGKAHTMYRARTGITTDAARKKIADRVERLIVGDEKRGDMGMKSVFGLGSSVVTNDWSATINESCEQILESYYSGTPPLNLYTDDSDDDDVWRIPGLLSEDTNLIYGQSGSGKSYLALVWGQAIQHGVAVCGLRTIQGQVLLIDYETTKSKMRRRMKRVDAGLGVDGEPMLYIPASVPLAQMVEPLQGYVSKHNVDFLIIDSLARASGGKITDEEGVGMMFESIRQLERPCLLIHHTNRGDEYYGSPYIRANTRNLWRLRSVKNEGTSKLSIQLEQEKENDGPGIGNLGFVLEFVGDPIDPESVTLTPQDASTVPELRKYLGLTQRLIAYLEETPYHRMEIDSIPVVLSLNEARKSTLRNYIWALKNDTGKYKFLAEKMHVDNAGTNLCLNTTVGYEDSPKPEEASPLVEAALEMGGQIIEDKERGITV
jgi:hypothetical protein